jgi:hypothetical protein
VHYHTFEGNDNRTKCDISRSFTDFFSVDETGEGDFVYDVYKDNQPTHVTRVSIFTSETDDEGSPSAAVHLRTFNQQPFLKCVQKYTDNAVQYETLLDTTVNYNPGRLLSAFVSARFSLE